jgi:D-mannonate dehydratase
LCCGSWLEGGKMTGADPVEMIKYFGPRKKLFKIHFRNVSAPLPHFTETMIDDGYYDMSKIMKALVEVKFEGIVVPGLGSDPAAEGRGRGGAGRGPAEGFRPNPALAYLLGCMNAMLIAAQGKQTKG